MVLGSGNYNTNGTMITKKVFVTSKLREFAHSQTPLKLRIEETQKKLQIQIAKDLHTWV